MDVKLFPELVERIYEYLDPVSALALGSCSTRLQEIMIDRSFENILDKVEFQTKWRFGDEDEENRKMSMNRELIKHLVNFIDLVPDEEDSNLLTFYLILTISSQFPSRTWEKIEVRVQEPFYSLSVDSWGFLLLTQTKASLRLVSCSVTMRAGRSVSGDLLVALGSLAEQRCVKYGKVDEGEEVIVVEDLEVSAEEELGHTEMCEEPVEMEDDEELVEKVDGENHGMVELDVFFLGCSTPEEETALASLLARCHTWTIDNLSLCDDVQGRIWSGMREAAERGKVATVNVETEVVKKGRTEDLRMVWENTQIGWSVGQVIIFKHEGTEKGWKKIKRILGSSSELGPGDLDSEEEEVSGHDVDSENKVQDCGLKISYLKFGLAFLLLGAAVNYFYPFGSKDL